MKPYAACTTAVLALLLAGTAQAQLRDGRAQSLDLLRMLTDKPWIGLGPHNRWDRAPRIDMDLGYTGLGPHLPPVQVAEDRNYLDDEIRGVSEKRSAVATALNSGRRRRQPTPALGKAVTPYVGVGVLNDMGSFFDSLRDNLETLVSLSPQERSTLFQDPPSVVPAPASNTGGGGSGIRKLYALRPLRPTGNIRSYNRRSLVEADGGYPGANHHDPGLLWTGLGR
ncbi:unnamed protein product [Spodoptera littoralis]|uniref:Uncharacterized protein n=2 Tax=Spodoptera TaxID=7106 RepID=A0A9P0N0G4_SPOLI|nr:uncharacterized protein LOC111356644 isoform X3 [Spodoptera litura]CAB3507530.1 unnamed protein product [Spodoptera littoralis]CAH1637066.1 unnamed protein product [Spodoptera littoralis]